MKKAFNLSFGKWHQEIFVFSSINLLFRLKTGSMQKISFLTLLFLEIPTKQTFDLEDDLKFLKSCFSINLLLRLNTGCMPKISFLGLAGSKRRSLVLILTFLTENCCLKLVFDLASCWNVAIKGGKSYLTHVLVRRK